MPKASLRPPEAASVAIPVAARDDRDHQRDGESAERHADDVALRAVVKDASRLRR